MALPRVYIDGQEGTTGLHIREMLANREDIDLILIPEQDRKNDSARKDCFRAADIIILCLPDEAATSALELIKISANSNVRVIDTSTVRRTNPEWVYGLPELSGNQRDLIKCSKQVVNPGCYAAGFILAIRPLVDSRLVYPELSVTVNAVSGYSGGGREMIEKYDNNSSIPFCLYGLDMCHKHIPEMHMFSGLYTAPVFVPSVTSALQGMLISIPLSMNYHIRRRNAFDVHQCWLNRYAHQKSVNVFSVNDMSCLRDKKFLDLPVTGNQIELFVFTDEHDSVLLVARLDNLGKGAAGNAVQCLNLMLGFDEYTGLNL